MSLSGSIRQSKKVSIRINRTESTGFIPTNTSNVGIKSIRVKFELDVQPFRSGRTVQSWSDEVQERLYLPIIFLGE